MVRPPHAPGRTQEPHEQRARGTRPADRPPRPAPGFAPAGPPRLRGGRSPSLRPGRLDGIRSLPLPSGVGRGFDPGRRNGRSPCRRPGGPAPKRWQRRPSRSPVTPRTQPRSRRASTGGDRPPSGEHPATGRPGGPSDPNRERCRSGVVPGVRGGAAPRQPPQGTDGSVATRSKLYVDAPSWASADSEPSWWQWAKYCRMSGLLMQRLFGCGPVWCA